MKVVEAVIPCAGYGTRFLPVSKTVPKELLPVVDRPIIHYIVEEAYLSGIKKVYLVTSPWKKIDLYFRKKRELESFLRKKKKEELLKVLSEVDKFPRVKKVYQRNPKGLGHAVFCARDVIKREFFAVLLGDDIIVEDEPFLKKMIKVLEKNPDSYGIIALQEVKKDETDKYGIVKGVWKDDLFQIEGLVEKPSPAEAPSTLAVVGRYILHRDVFNVLKRTKPGKGGEIQLTDALNQMAQRKPFYGVLIEGRRFDAGDKLGFVMANIFFALERAEWRTELIEFLNKCLN